MAIKSKACAGDAAMRLIDHGNVNVANRQAIGQQFQRSDRRIAPAPEKDIAKAVRKFVQRCLSRQSPHRRPHRPVNTAQVIDAVTVAQVNAAAKQVLDRRRSVTGILQPPANQPPAAALQPRTPGRCCRPPCESVPGKLRFGKKIETNQGFRGVFG